MPNQTEPDLSPEYRADLQRAAAAAYDAGRMDEAGAALDKLGCASFAEGIRHLVDGSILNKYLRPRQP